MLNGGAVIDRKSGLPELHERNPHDLQLVSTDFRERPQHQRGHFMGAHWDYLACTGGYPAGYDTIGSIRNYLDTYDSRDRYSVANAIRAGIIAE